MLQFDWTQRCFLNIAAQATDTNIPVSLTAFWSQLMTSNTLFIFHWTLWSIYKLFIIQLLEVSKFTSVFSKAAQFSSMIAHVQNLLFSSLSTAFQATDGSITLVLKSSPAQNVISGSHKNCPQCIMPASIPRLSTHRLCCLPSLYIPLGHTRCVQLSLSKYLAASSFPILQLPE